MSLLLLNFFLSQSILIFFPILSSSPLLPRFWAKNWPPPQPHWQPPPLCYSDHLLPPSRAAHIKIRTPFTIPLPLFWRVHRVACSIKNSTPHSQLASIICLSLNRSASYPRSLFHSGQPWKPLLNQTSSFLRKIHNTTKNSKPTNSINQPTNSKPINHKPRRRCS